MLADLKYIVIWWFEFFFIGALSLPLIFILFKNYWDKGYIFSKIISLIIVTYLVLVLGIFHVLPFTIPSIFLIILILLFFEFLYINKIKFWSEFKKILRTKWKIFMFEEILFFTVLVFWSYVRGFAPDIDGLEKFMDWGFVNSALRSQFMPPVDMWFSGFPINYYYFGHLLTAVLTKLSNLDSAITYNLAIASTCALTFVSTFSLSSNLVYSLIRKINKKQIITAGILSALLLTFGGNLHAVYKITKLNYQDKGKIIFTKDAFAKAANAYWYPDATRFIGFDPDIKDKTIHEFPIYSFVVADLHGHMNDIPIVIFFMAFLFALSLYPLKKGVNWYLVVPSAFLLSVAFMTNAWDFAVYGLVFAVYYFLYYLYTKNFNESFRFTFIHGILIILFWYLFTLPFSLNFTPMAEGLRLSDSHTPFYQLFILYGGFWLICIPFLIISLREVFSKKLRGNLNSSDIFVIALIITATILVIIPEIGYIKDIYIYEHRRANTMFKLVYQAFILYSLVSGYIFIKLKSHRFYKLIFILVFFCHLIYPYFAIRSYYGLKDYKGLWGLNFLKTGYPDNFEAIKWINLNIPNQPVMLEAVGDSYTQFNQVSMATGLPTVEGWIVHEWLWRGGYDQPSARATDVEKIYQSTDLSEIRKLLQKYSVQYIFVGDKEREKYPTLNENSFTDIGATIIFESGQTRIYKL